MVPGFLEANFSPISVANVSFMVMVAIKPVEVFCLATGVYELSGVWCYAFDVPRVSLVQRLLCWHIEFRVGELRFLCCS